MATITLSADTLISSLMPSGGGSLASGDTINLAGRSLIVDADAVSYPVTIANSGADANLELRDLSRIKLNATLPANVHPYIDPAHPLPVSAEPGIDGDPYRTPLTANARAEIQLNGDFGLGGGAASLPTATRGGRFWDLQSASYTAQNEAVFQNGIPVHIGDILLLYGQNDNSANWGSFVVLDYNEQTQTAIVDRTIPDHNKNNALCLVAGGVCISRDAGSSTYLSSTMTCGSLTVIGHTVGNSPKICGIHNANIVADRVMFLPTGNNATVNFYSGFIGENVSAKINQLVSLYTCPNYPERAPNGSTFDIGSIATWFFFGSGNNYLARATIGGGYVGTYCAPQKTFIGLQFALRDTKIIQAQAPLTDFCAMEVVDCIVAQSNVSIWMEKAGTIALPSMLHAPATATDVTWRYTDRTVAPGATLRLRCAWRREGSAATRASVAVTDPATWWPSLWPLGADALASVEFTGGTADWRQQLLTWRNTGTEAVTVRVWECVTGTTAGGYLKVEEVKGGRL